jgi:hypothetical protein
LKISQIAHTTAAEELYGSCFRVAEVSLLAAAARAWFTAAFSAADNECHLAWRQQYALRRLNAYATAVPACPKISHDFDIVRCGSDGTCCI